VPDLLAGTTVKANDTPVTVFNEQVGNYQFSNATFGVGTTGGTYADCGVAFVAPTTGRIEIGWSGEGFHSVAASAVELSPFVRTGTTVGAGTTFLASVINNKLRLVSIAINSITHGGMTMIVSGLTPGSSYNVRLDHRTNGATGNWTYRKVSVKPCT